jgi:hypothetical protein
MTRFEGWRDRAGARVVGEGITTLFDMLGYLV